MSRDVDSRQLDLEDLMPPTTAHVEVATGNPGRAWTTVLRLTLPLADYNAAYRQYGTKLQQKLTDAIRSVIPPAAT